MTPAELRELAERLRKYRDSAYSVHAIGFAGAFNDAAAALDAAAGEIERLREQARRSPAWLDEALNSGDGTYKP